MDKKKTNDTEAEFKKLMQKPSYFEEMLLLSAQELIAELMEKREISKADLARKLKTSKAHVTALLGDGRNLTLKSLANVCYHLGAEVKLDYAPISTKAEEQDYGTYHQQTHSAAEIAAPSNFGHHYLH